MPQNESKGIQICVNAQTRNLRFIGMTATLFQAEDEIQSTSGLCQSKPSIQFA